MKNLVLMVILACILLPIYFMNFRRDTMGVTNVYKILAGLNSNTFNYLSEHAEDLKITSKIKSLSATTVHSVDFMASCVSLNRPCLINGLSKTWPAYNNWSYDSKVGSKYLADKIGKTPVRVYVDPEPSIDSSSIETSFEDPWL